MDKPSAEERKVLDAASIEEGVKKLLGLSTFEPTIRHWLETGNWYLNRALGALKYGLAFGKVFEFAGEEHGGKTLLALIIAGMAQAQGAAVGYMDLEESRDEAWATKMGLDYSQVVKLYPKMVSGRRKKKTTKPETKQVMELRRSSRQKEELFEEMRHQILPVGYRRRLI